MSACRRTLLACAALLLALAACSRAERPDEVTGPAGAPAAEVRLGLFPNVTHAAGILGDEAGLFEGQLGDTVLTVQAFNAGGDAVNALLGGSLDVTYIGSGPAINAFAASSGEAVRLVAGATIGGAQLVVRPGITSPAQLRGTTLTTPQLGNTQDVALKTWLADNGLEVGPEPDQVQVANLENPRALDAFRTGSVDGGWLPEPWSSRLVLEAGASVLVDERELWPGGAFPTTVLIARTEFLRQHPDTVRALLRGHLAAVDLAAADPDRAKELVNRAITEQTGNPVPEPVLERAFSGTTLTADPVAATLTELARDGVTAGVVDEPPRLTGFLELEPLNAELAVLGRPPVGMAGLDASGEGS